MKNFFIFLFVLIFLSVGFLSSGPFLTLYLIKESIEEKNSTKLKEEIMRTNDKTISNLLAVFALFSATVAIADDAADVEAVIHTDGKQQYWYGIHGGIERHWNARKLQPSGQPIGGEDGRH